MSTLSTDPLAPLLALIQQRPARAKDYIILDAVLYIIVTGCSWRNLDLLYPAADRPAWRRVQRAYRHWAANDKMHDALLQLGETGLAARLTERRAADAKLNANRHVADWNNRPEK